MASAKKYGYYIRGNELAIVEKDLAFDIDLDSHDFGPGSNRPQWRSPQATVTNGIEFEYSYVLSLNAMQDENYELDLPLYLQKALIYYMKAKSFEDVLDVEKYEYFMMRFRKQIERFNNARTSGMRVVAAGPFAVK